MLDLVYYLCVFPLERLMSSILTGAVDFCGSWGWGIALLSLAVNILLLPFYHLAEKWQRDERRIQERMEPKLREFKKVFRGRIRHMIISTLYRQNEYSSWMALRASLGLLIQIPFFFAAYHLLSTADALHGQAFLMIHDLAEPDGLLVLASGQTLNVLPFLMSGCNLLSAAVYSARLGRREAVQLFGLTALFFILLYQAPAALLLYWTWNNIFSLGKNIVYRFRTNQAGEFIVPERLQTFFAALGKGVCLFFRKLAEGIPSRLDLYSAAGVMVFFVAGLVFQRKLGPHWPTFLCAAGAALLNLGLLGLRLIRYRQKARPEQRALGWVILLIGCAVFFSVGGLTSYRKLADPRSWAYFRLFAFNIACFTACCCSFRPLLPLLERLNVFFQQSIPQEHCLALGSSAAALSGFLLFCHSPLLLYASDVNFFYEDPVRLLAACLGFFAVYWLVWRLILALSPALSLPFVSALLVWLSLAAVGFVFVAQGDYGLMDGFILQDIQPLKTRWAILVDLACFGAAGALLLAVCRRRKIPSLTRAMQGITGILLIVSVYQVVSLPKAQILEPETAGAQTPEYTQRLFSFSPDRPNVLVFMLDMFTGGHLQKIIDEEPELIERYDGFVWYPDTMAPGATTLLSMAALLGGEEFTPPKINKSRPASLSDAMHEGFAVLPGILAPQGWDLAFADVEELTTQKFAQVCPQADDTLIVGRSFMTAYTGFWRAKHRRPSPMPESQAPFLAVFGLFRAAPWTFRQHIYHNGAWLGTQTLVHNPAEGPLALLDSLPDIASGGASRPTLKFIVSQVTHYPWRLDPDTCMPDAPGGETRQDGIIIEHYHSERCALRVFARFLDWLKAHELYDNTMIILVSDHDGNDSQEIGQGFAHLRPPKMPFKPHALLLLKGFNQRGPLRVDKEARMSSADIVPLICAESPVDCPEKFQRDPRAMSGRVRTHSAGMASIRRHEKRRFNTVDFSVNGTMFKPDNWKKLP